MLRNCRIPKFEREQNLKTVFQNVPFLLQIALWVFKKVPKPRISVFSILRGRVNAWVDDI